MTERVASDASRNVCRRPEDDEASQVSNDKAAPAPMSKDRLVSAPPPDWDRVPNSCDDNAAMAARNAPIGPPAPPKGAGASTNAARTSERAATDGPYAAAGKTHDGKNAFVGVAAVKGRAAERWELEKASASIQVGQQNEAQVTARRMSYSGKNVSVTAEAATANAHVGVENSDGSRGFNVGAGANVGSIEVTVKHEGSSATIGLSKGAGAEAHAGIRDEDNDGHPEVCVRIAAGFLIGGGCYEMPIVIRP